MNKRFCVLLAGSIGVCSMLNACGQKDVRIPADLRKNIALGEKIFAEKQCGKCHSTTGDFGRQEQQGPDLSSVFRAMDSLFIKSHLQFTELSAMPPINLTPHEISALTQYIAALHGKTHMDPNLKDPDAICPVSGAPLKKSVAEANHLKVTYKGVDYYFVSPDAKIVFERDPEWHSKSGYLAAQKGARPFLE